MVEVDVIRRIVFDGHDEPLEVGPWPDDPGLVNLRACNDAGREYWGNLNLALKPDQADAIGKALIASAEECRASEAK